MAGSRRRRALRALVALAGVGCLVAGLALIVGPLFGLWQRGHADQNAINSWITKPLSGGKHRVCGSGAPDDYALVTFDGLAQYNYAGVAGDGTWELLKTRSMVHYHGSADPGQAGNSIIAFHREPDYEHIDQLDAGQIVSVQDRTCQTHRYQVTQRWDLAPDDVTQLVPTQGHDLTLITCDPWFDDSRRLVWRATLIS